MFGKKKGQATIEYLVLLAVAIIIALVIFAFMGWIPGFAGSLKERQVKLYWSSQYPIQIREYKVTNNSITIFAQNVADYAVNITRIEAGGNSIANSTDGRLLPGESDQITFNSTATLCETGKPYELSNIKLFYNIEGGISNMSIVGDRPFVGTCQ